MTSNEILTKPIDMAKFKTSPAVVINKRYLTINKKTGKIKETIDVSVWRINPDETVSTKNRNVYDDDEWHKTWQNPENVLDNINYFATHNGDKYETPTTIKKTENIVIFYKENYGKTMKGSKTNKKNNDFTSKLENSVRNMF